MRGQAAPRRPAKVGGRAHRCPPAHRTTFFAWLLLQGPRLVLVPQGPRDEPAEVVSYRSNTHTGAPPRRPLASMSSLSVLSPASLAWAAAAPLPSPAATVAAATPVLPTSRLRAHDPDALGQERTAPWGSGDGHRFISAALANRAAAAAAAAAAAFKTRPPSLVFDNSMPQATAFDLLHESTVCRPAQAS